MKNKLVLIIGINGVGKEHIKACNSLGLKYILYDIDISKFKDKEFVFNIWGKHKEKISLKNLVCLTNNVDDWVEHDITHVIISVPDEYHSYYVNIIDSIYNNTVKVLVEKPALCSYGKIDWVGYTKLNVGKSVKEEIVFYVETVERNWDNHIALDLLGHIYYTYLIFKNKKIGIRKVIDTANNNSFAILLDNNIRLEVVRNWSDTYLTVDGNKRYNDYGLIFHNQMKDFVSGKSNLDIANFVEKNIIDLLGGNLCVV